MSNQPNLPHFQHFNGVSSEDEIYFVLDPDVKDYSAYFDPTSPHYITLDPQSPSLDFGHEIMTRYDHIHIGGTEAHQTTNNAPIKPQPVASGSSSLLLRQQLQIGSDANQSMETTCQSHPSTTWVPSLPAFPPLPNPPQQPPRLSPAPNAAQIA